MSERFDEPAHSQAQPSRRTVMRTAAWSIPAVAAVSAAPAFAASCTTKNYVVSSFALNAGVRSNQNNTWTGTHAPAGQPSIMLTATSTWIGSMARESEHFQSIANAGGLNVPGLRMHQERGTRDVGTAQYNHRGVFKYTFTRPVKDLTFTITDVDLFRQSTNSGRQWDDRVALSSPSSTFSVLSRGNNIASNWTGVSESAAFRVTANDNLTNGEGAGNVRVRWAAPVSEFTIDFWNGFSNADASDRSQLIFISQMSFNYDVETCV
jgi:hypothetical protein